MKNIYFLSLLILSFKVTAQNIPYEKLDSISSAISQYQLRSDNLTYNDGKDDYELSFPENNFQIFSSTNTATKVVNKKSGEKEFVCITENIDLSKVDEAFQVQYPGQAGVVRMNFPEGVKTQIYTNGVYTNTVREYYLEFFYNRNEEGSRNQLLIQLDKTFNFLKLGNKISKEQFLTEEKIKSDKVETPVAKELTVDDVVEKYAEAFGGADKIKSIKTLVSEGYIQMQGLEIPVKSWSVHNEAMRMDMEIQGTTNSTVVTNNTAWTLFPMQRQRKPVDADHTVAKEGMEELDLTGDLLDYKQKGSTAELLGKESMDGNDFYKIRLIRKSGTVVMLFIDASTYLPAKRIINKKMQGTVVEITETMSNYKKNDDGFVYASSYHYSPAGTSLVYSSFLVNKDIDPKLFEKP